MKSYLDKEFQISLELFSFLESHRIVLFISIQKWKYQIRFQLKINFNYFNIKVIKFVCYEKQENYWNSMQRTEIYIVYYFQGPFADIFIRKDKIKANQLYYIFLQELYTVKFQVFR